MDGIQLFYSIRKSNIVWDRSPVLLKIK